MSYLKTLAAGAFIALAPISASALTLLFDDSATSSNTPATGASAQVELSFSSFDAGIIQMDVTVTNTTGTTTFGAGATAATLTGFGIDTIAGASLGVVSSSPGAFLDTPLNNADFSPFGLLDAAWADNNSFNGGNANGGMPTGSSDTGLFARYLTSLTPGEFEAAVIEAMNDGNDGIDAGVRFQQVNAGEGSDKLIFAGLVSTTPVPLPASGLLLVAGLGGLVAARRRATKR